MRARELFIALTFLLLLAGSSWAQSIPQLDFFYSTGCRECDETREFVEEILAQYDLQVELIPRNISDRENLELLWAWEDRTGKKSAEPTSLVIGGHFLNGESEILTEFEELIISGAYLDVPELQPSSSRGVRDEFSSFGPWAVVGAGLVDGINPCAFTVLVMLISFLTVTGVSRQKSIQVGVAFTFGVFIAYLLVGLGLLGVMLQGQRYRVIADIVYLLVGGGALGLGLISIRDGIAVYRSGQFSDAKLRLPPSLLNKIQRVLAGKLTSPRLIFSSFTCGLMVSGLELVCTGQIYLPTITLIMQEPDLRSSALIYLILYCLAFILPLAVIFILVYLGKTVSGVGSLSSRYSWLVKILTGILFIGLGLFLLLNF